MLYLFLSLVILTLSCKPDDSIYLPVLETAFVTDITENSARSGGNIRSDGGTEILKKVFVGILQGNPTISDNFSTNEGQGSGNFAILLTGLDGGE